MMHITVSPDATSLGLHAALQLAGDASGGCDVHITLDDGGQFVHLAVVFQHGAVPECPMPLVAVGHRRLGPRIHAAQYKAGLMPMGQEQAENHIAHIRKIILTVLPGSGCEHLQPIRHQRGGHGIAATHLHPHAGGLPGCYNARTDTLRQKVVQLIRLHTCLLRSFRHGHP